VLSEQDVLGLFERCSNAGRWGDDDERGTLNHITPAKILQALALPRLGRTVSLAHDLSPRSSPKNNDPMRYRMLHTGHADSWSALDSIEVQSHGFAVTHLDAVGHVFHDGVMYNGRRAADHITPAGMTANSIMAMADGIVTRGVFLDVARARGVPWLDAGEGVSAADLSAAEQLAGVSVEPGDAIFVRTGLGAREAEQGDEDPSTRAGLTAGCVPWLHDHGVAVFSGDCVDQLPSGYVGLPLPLHQVGMVAMGLCMLDTTDVETLAAVTAEANTNEFLLFASPLRIPGGTGSAVNPIAVF
jgi:kynurenine formamidase